MWVALVALAGLAALYRSDDHDYWFHLAAGRSIVEDGLPTRETWCLAARGQAPWLSEWLFHVLLYGLRLLGGDLGVALWRAAWTAGAMAIVVRLVQTLGAGSWSAVLLAPLVLAVSRDRFQPRPEQIFLVLVLFGILRFESARRSGRDGTRWLIPAQALWANLQGSWVFGPVVAWTYALAETWRSPWGAWMARRAARRTLAPVEETSVATPGPPPFLRVRNWAALGLVLWAASAVVPLPLETLARPFRFLSDVAVDPLTGSIEELRAWSWTQDRREPFTLLLALSLFAAIVGGRRVWRISPALALLWAGTLGLGVLGFRFRGLAAWIAFAPLAVALTPARPSWLERLRPLPSALAGAAGAIWLATAPQFVFGVAPRMFAVPVRATAFADSVGIDGPVLNTFHYGGYILWARGEQHPPLIDGRGRGSRELRRLFSQAHADPVALDSLLEAWNFTHAIVQPPQHENDRLAINLSRRLEWALVFADDAGLLYVRWSRHPELARARAYRYFTPDFLAMTQMSARSLADSGLRRLLEDELLRARAESPYHSRASMWLGLLALGKREGAAAVKYLEETERLAPATRGLALRQGMAYEMAGDSARARRAYRRALRDPDEAPMAEAMLESVEGSK